MNRIRYTALAATRNVNESREMTGLAEKSWPARLGSSRAETLYQVATVAAALMLLMSV